MTSANDIHVGQPTLERGATEPRTELKDRLNDGIAQVADVARQHPRTTIATGAAVVLGAVAAVALPLLRGATATSGGKKASAKRSHAKKSTGSGAKNGADD